MTLQKVVFVGSVCIDIVTVQYFSIKFPHIILKMTSSLDAVLVFLNMKRERKEGSKGEKERSF